MLTTGFSFSWHEVVSMERSVKLKYSGWGSHWGWYWIVWNFHIPKSSLLSLDSKFLPWSELILAGNPWCTKYFSTRIFSTFNARKAWLYLVKGSIMISTLLMSLLMTKSVGLLLTTQQWPVNLSLAMVSTYVKMLSLPRVLSLCHHKVYSQLPPFSARNSVGLSSAVLKLSNFDWQTAQYESSRMFLP